MRLAESYSCRFHQHSSDTVGEFHMRLRGSGFPDKPGECLRLEKSAGQEVFETPGS